MKAAVLATEPRAKGRPGSGRRARFTLHAPPRALVRADAARWDLYAEVMRRARRGGTAFCVGGGLAAAFYTGLWRPTKDLDLYVLPSQREAMIAATQAAGMHDYFEQQPYDRKWIYRAVRDGTIVDVIWALANGYGAVEPRWLVAGPVASVRRERFALLAPEDIALTKLHVLQRDRCDWPDLLNLLYAAAPRLDWDRLLASCAEEERLLASLVMLFTWVAPARAAHCPAWLWERLRIPPPDAAGPMRDQVRIDRLDSRPWFTTAAPG